MDDEIECSFCGKSRNEARKIIAGPRGVYICSECIDLCNDIILEDIDAEGGAVRWPWRRVDSPKHRRTLGLASVRPSLHAPVRISGPSRRRSPGTRSPHLPLVDGATWDSNAGVGYPMNGRSTRLMSPVTVLQIRS